MPVNHLVHKILLWYRLLSARDKLLLNILMFIFALILPFFAYTSIDKSLINQNNLVTKKRAEFETLKASLDRYKQLKLKRDELTSKYLSSSVSYEKLTSHLDKLIKNQVKDSSYELKPGKEENQINDNLISKKWIIRIRDCSFEDLPGLLTALETGPPPLFVQSVEVTKGQRPSKISVQLEVVTIEEGTIKSSSNT